MSVSQPSRWFSAYALVLLLAGAGLWVWSLFRMPLMPSVALGVLLLAALISENAGLPLPRGGSTSLAYPLSMAAGVLLGPSAAGLVAISCTAAIRELRRGLDVRVAVANAGQLTLSVLIPSWLYISLGGRVLMDSGAATSLSAADFPGILLPLLAFGLGTFGANAALVSIGIALLHGISMRQVWESNIAWTFPLYMSMLVLGVAVAQVLSIHPAAFVLLVFPLILSRQVYKHYLGLKNAYLDMVRSLVAALEAKDPYTRGHSDRVAQYAEQLARAFELPDDRVERLRIAAQLHDLGKLAIASEVLGKPSMLSESEFADVRGHPVAGAEMISGVPALRHLSDIVRYHHERYDGRGYAEGLSGQSIPFEARLLAIVDSYDAMTTARAYRDSLSRQQATDEIMQCAGTQFDPELATRFVDLIRSGDRENR